MHAKMIKKLSPGLVVAVVAVLMISVPVLAGSKPASPAARPVLQVPAPVTVDLYAMQGTLLLDGGSVSVPIWGFTTSATGPAALPGPVIDVVAGSPVTITLTNVDLPENVSLVIPGMDMAPDTTGVALGDTATYIFTASEPGTYLYYSGVDEQAQMPMGLYGAMIVRSTTVGQAYDDAATAYDEEALLVLSEIDPDFNEAIFLGTYGTSQTAFDYAPEYWLINGEVYPDTDPIAATSGDRVLVRYVNAGSREHTMMVLGMHMRTYAADGFLLPSPFDTFSPALAAGQTQDLIATMPTVATASEFPLFNREGYLNNGQTSPGGMMTMLQVGP